MFGSVRTKVITETSPCAIGNFRKWLLYMCFGLNNIYLVTEIILIQKYTLSCKTGSDSNRNVYMKVISCKLCESYTVKIMVGAR